MNKKPIPVLLLLALLLATLSACAFVTYHPYESPEEGLEEKRAELLASLATLSDVGYYDSEDAKTYELQLQDAVNELNECQTVNELEKTFKKHKNLILAIPARLPNVIATLLSKLETLVTLSDYRAEEQATILALQEACRQSLEGATTVKEAEDTFYRAQADIAALKTAAVYYAEELAAMKKTYINEIKEYKLFVFYGKTEQERLTKMIGVFQNEVARLTDKESVETLFSRYRELMDGVPTKADAYLAEKEALLAEWQTTLADHVSEETAAALIAELKSLAYCEEINTYAATYLLENATLTQSKLRDLGAVLLDNAVIPSLYREKEQDVIADAVAKSQLKLLLCRDKEDILALVSETKETLAAVADNETLWQREDDAFLTCLKEAYGENHLALPKSLTEANDLYELAAIIDFYAFYQTSNESFLRDTFRVRLNYDNNNPQWEINEVYWYAELLRSAVGITGAYEADGKHLVITLIPYALATESNLKDEITIDRYDSLITLPNAEGYQERDEDFDAFAYLNYDKTLTGIWNTQQLWYALEHEYLPVPVEGSAADLALKEAKKILRAIIREGMSDEEKIYAIFSWFGQYVTYDEGYEDYLYPEDREHFPDSLAATLKSFHIEGALFENLAVCCSYAKTYLLFLRLEGIEAYRITLHAYEDNAIDNLGMGGYGSHAILAIRGSDGKFYYSDTEQAYNTSTNFPYLVKYHQLMVPPHLHWPYDNGYTYLFPDLEMGEGYAPLTESLLTYAGQSLLIRSEEQLQAILTAFAAESRSEVQISFFVDGETPFSVNELLATSGLAYTTFNFGDLTEYMVYR